MNRAPDSTLTLPEFLKIVAICAIGFVLIWGALALHVEGMI
jgi:hypothetical protein